VILATPQDPVVTFTYPEPDPSALDPLYQYEWLSWEVLRCCLTRTLMSYNGRPAEEGGSDLQPDLASAEPEVSVDGLTWTFRLREGLHYGPPLEDQEITAGDIVRGLERTARLGAQAFTYSFYYSPIEGFDAFAAGEVESISGLETPDAHTLVIRLTHRQGDMGYRLSLPASAPIPADPDDPDAPFGAATGHDDGYGRFLVSSGPYALEGSDDLDFSLPPDSQPPVAGLRPGSAISLVRNPSWTPGADPLRAAYADRIEIVVVPTLSDAHDLVEGGDADLVLTIFPPPQAPAALVDRYRADPSLGLAEIRPRDLVLSMMMNVAAPPFDDIHVRRAVQYLVDKQDVIDQQGGALTGRIATHIVPDAIEGFLLAGYDPYRTPGGAGDLAAARAEMAQSAYDSDGDGICDFPECVGITAIEPQLPEPRQNVGPRVQANLAQIGLDIRPEVLDFGTFYTRAADPTQRVPMLISVPVGKDFPSASSLLPPMFHSSSIGAQNSVLTGASAEQLLEWEYPVTSVLNVDGRIDQCLALIGDAQTECWATLDQYLMEEVAAYVPLTIDLHVQVIPSRVVQYSFNQFTSVPALDRLAVSR
jgi:peptide/nickel transport system substrate-binding protein